MAVGLGGQARPLRHSRRQPAAAGSKGQSCVGDVAGPGLRACPREARLAT